MTEIPPRGRLSTRLLAHGREPDPRFTLANERTFLAWIRTALAFLAGGVAVEAFAADVFADPYRTVISVLTISVGLLISVGAACAGSTSSAACDWAGRCRCR